MQKSLNACAIHPLRESVAGPWLLWILCFAFLCASSARADEMVLDMGDGTIQSFNSVMLIGAEFVSDAEGLSLNISLGPGQTAHPVSAARIKSLKIGTGGQGRAYDLLVNSRSGAKQHRNVTLVSFSNGEFQAIPEGGAQTFPLPSTGVMQILEAGTMASVPSQGAGVAGNNQAAMNGMDATMGGFPPPSGGGFPPPDAGFAAPPPQENPGGFTPGQPDPNVNPFGDPSLYEGVVDADGYSSASEAMGSSSEEVFSEEEQAAMAALGEIAARAEDQSPVVTILGSIIGVVNLVCLVIVLVNLFTAKGPLHGVLGFCCGLYLFIWGWAEWKGSLKMPVMITWTIGIVTNLVLNFSELARIFGGG